MITKAHNEQLKYDDDAWINYVKVVFLTSSLVPFDALSLKTLLTTSKNEKPAKEWGERRAEHLQGERATPKLCRKGNRVRFSQWELIYSTPNSTLSLVALEASQKPRELASYVLPSIKIIISHRNPPV